MSFFRRKGKDSPQTEELRAKLQQVQEDDKDLLDLNKRARQILFDPQHHLPDVIRKALGVLS